MAEELIAHCSPTYGLWGIDPSDDQLAYTRNRPTVKTVEFRLGDAQAPRASISRQCSAVADNPVLNSNAGGWKPNMGHHRSPDFQLRMS